MCNIHDILRTVLTVPHVKVCHRTHKGIEHGSAGRRLGLACGQFLCGGGLVIDTFYIALHEPSADRKTAGILISAPIGIEHVKTVFVIYFLRHNIDF